MTGPEASQREFDVVVVGSGGGGLTAAITAAAHGLRTLVLEKAPVVGGTTAVSGGMLWVPNSPQMRRRGAADSADDAFTYLDTLAGEHDPIFSERRRAYVDTASEMIEFLMGQGLEFLWADGYPDHYQDVPGSHPRGRPLEVPAFDTNRLGPWREKLRPLEGSMRPVKFLKSRASELRQIALVRTNPRGALMVTRVGARSLAAKVRRQNLAVCGEALVARLLDAAVRAGVEIWTSSPLLGLDSDGRRVVGVIGRHEGEALSISATRGVVLASGGYARSDEMRAVYARQPSSRVWSQSNDGDTGDWIPMTLELGARLARMEDCWYIPSSVSPDGRAIPHQPDRTRPHSIIVDKTGIRYVNEASNQNNIGHAMYERNEIAPAIPSWLIIDNEHRKKYPFGVTAPGITPARWFETGYMKKGETLEGLAAACGIDPNGLARSVKRFNELVASGHDDDFERGDTIYEHHFGDPGAKPNPAFGAVATPPFYAVEIYPGDVGTSGGLVTDRHARVLREDGSVIEGLYATGNNAVDVAGGKNFGPGATIGTTMTFGYLAAGHLGSRESAAAATS